MPSKRRWRFSHWHVRDLCSSDLHVVCLAGQVLQNLSGGALTQPLLLVRAQIDYDDARPRMHHDRYQSRTASRIDRKDETRMGVDVLLKLQLL